MFLGMSSKTNIIIPLGMPPQKQEALCCQRIGTLGLLYVDCLFCQAILMKLLFFFNLILYLFHEDYMQLEVSYTIVFI